MVLNEDSNFYKNSRYGKYPVLEYLLWAFCIAWLGEALIIIGEYFNLLSGTIGVIITFGVIGLLAGFAPVYAVYIIAKKYKQISGIKDFLRYVFIFKRPMSFIPVMLLFFGWRVVANVLYGGESTGDPWYFSILSIPLMMFGGGMEEVGWRGFLTPHLDKKLSYPVASLFVGVIWAVWHLPLWFINSTNQSDMNFLTFTLGCVVLAFILSLLYTVTKSVFACILLHSWDNSLGSILTFEFLNNRISFKLLIVSICEIILAMTLCYVIQAVRRRKMA